MKRKALAIVLLAALTAGTALAFNYSDQERREGQEREREVRREQSQRPRVHPLAVALELQKKLELSEEQIGQLLERWEVYGPARTKHTELIAKLRAQYEDSDGEKRQLLGNRIESTIKEFNTWSEKLTRETFDIVGPDRTEVIRQTMREISGRREGERERAVDRERRAARSVLENLRERDGGREREARQDRDVRSDRPRVHTLGMALELQGRLGLNEEQIKKFQDMWGQYKQVQLINNARLEELEQKIAAIQRELGQYQERQAGAVYESLGPDQREMLRNRMREINQQSDRPTDRAPQTDRRRVTDRVGGGQGREFEQMVAELRKLVAAGEITGNQAEERIAAYHRSTSGRADGDAGMRRDRDTGPISEFNRAVAEIKAAVAAGRLTGNQAEERIAEMQRRLGERGDGGQDREFERAVAELRAAVESGRMTAGEAEERIAAMRQRMGGGERRLKNLIGQHPMAYALEGARKIGLTERQVKTLQDAWSEIYPAGAELSEALRRLQMRADEFRESGEWNDRTAAEVDEHGRTYVGQLEELTAHANEILSDTLNKEQMNGVEELMAAAKKREGGREGARRPENPIGHHPMAYALEGRKKIGLTERQYATLQEAWKELYEEAAKYGELLRQSEQDITITLLNESGKWDGRRSGKWEAELVAAITVLHWKADEILADTLNKEQMNGVEELMAAAKNREGGRGPVNPMNGHPMAWALELHETLKLNDKQVATLKESYSELRRQGDMLNENRANLQEHLAQLLERYFETSPRVQEIKEALKDNGARRERLQARGTEFLSDTLNGEQLAQLRRIIADNRENDG